jgi:hypothetical protein
MATITSSNSQMTTRRNLFWDPRLVNDWTGVLHETGGPNGNTFRRYTTTAPVSEYQLDTTGSSAGLDSLQQGVPVTVSWYARASAEDVQTRVDPRWFIVDGDPSYTEDGTAFPVTAEWQRFQQTFTVPTAEGTVFLNLNDAFHFVGDIGADETLDIADIQQEIAFQATDYFDGTYPGASWVGTADFGASVASPVEEPVQVEPLLVLSYGYQRGSRNVVHDVLDGGPRVTLRGATTRSGTLSLLFAGRYRAQLCEDMLNTAARFTFDAPESGTGEHFDFVVAGRVALTKAEGVDFWIIDVDFREVDPL